MKVLLLQDIRGIGKKNDIKEVSDGYARNFLIPKKMAAPADANVQRIKEGIEKKEADLIKKYKNIVIQLEGRPLEFKIKTGKKGEVFGSITKEDIKKSLQEGMGVDTEVILPQSLKTLGEHFVEINLGRGIRGKALVVIKPL